MFSGSSGSLRASRGTHDNGSSFALLSGPGQSTLCMFDISTGHPHPDHRLHNPAYARTREVQYTTITTRRASVQGSRTLFALTDSDTFSCIGSQSGEVVQMRKVTHPNTCTLHWVRMMTLVPDMLEYRALRLPTMGQAM